MSKRFDSKVAVITGGCQGIGLAIARLMGQQGASVYIADINTQKGIEAQNQLTDDGIKCVFVKCDITQEKDLEALRDTIAEGQVDALFNNAGMELSKGIETTSISEWDLLSSVNLRGVFLTTKTLLPLLEQSKNAAVVNTASISGLIGWPESMAYCATKGGVVNLTRQLACDLAAKNIRVNCICPGTTLTPMIQRLIWEGPNPEETAKEIADMHLLKRFAQPEEIAQAAVFLASDDASFITGAILPVDGGYTAK